MHVTTCVYLAACHQNMSSNQSNASNVDDVVSSRKNQEAKFTASQAPVMSEKEGMHDGICFQMPTRC